MVDTKQWQGQEPQNWGGFPWRTAIFGLVVALILFFVVGPMVQSYNLARSTNPTIVGSSRNPNTVVNETNFANVTITFQNTSAGCNATRSQIGTVAPAQRLFPKPCGNLSTDEIFSWLEETLDNTNKWIVRVLRERSKYVRQLRLLLRFLPPAP